MSNIIRSDPNKAIAYVQSVEKQQDSLALRKRLAIEHGLTSIGEFIEWWAVVHKDSTWRLMDEKGQYMRDPSIAIIDTKERNIWWSMWEIKKETYYTDGLGREVESKNTIVDDTVNSSSWIFSAKDGIIIVVDDRSDSRCRLYTVAWDRIPIPEWRDFDRFAIAGLFHYDDFSLLWWFIKSSDFSQFPPYDRRKNIISGMIPISLSHQFKRDNGRDAGRVEKQYNLDCGGYSAYNLIDKKWERLQTDMGYYYANTKRAFDGSCWLLPCRIPGLDDKERKQNWWLQWFDRPDTPTFIKRPVFCAVNIEGKPFKDEFGNMPVFDDPYRLNNFDAEGYAPFIADRKLRYWSEDHTPWTVMGNQSGCIFFINKEWQYRRDESGKIISIPFYKTIGEGNSRENDVQWYELFPELWAIKVRQKNDGNITYSWFDYYGNMIQDPDTDGQQSHIDWWNAIVPVKDHYLNIPWTARVYQHLSHGLTAHGYSMRQGYHHHSNKKFSFGWEVRIVNSKFDYKNVKFPNGEFIFAINLDNPIKSYQDGYIFHGKDMDPNQWNYSYVKINGLIARYVKDAEWREMNWLSHIIPIQDKFLLIQREENQPYYILDKNRNYVKNAKGEKVNSQYPPFYSDGVFLVYHSDDAMALSKGTMTLIKAYFEDGTTVWHEAAQMPWDSKWVITATKADLLKRLE